MSKQLLNIDCSSSLLIDKTFAYLSAPIYIEMVGWIDEYVCVSPLPRDSYCAPSPTLQNFKYNLNNLNKCSSQFIVPTCKSFRTF